MVFRDDCFQRALASMVWKFFDKRSRGVLGSGIENKQLADELHKPVIKKFKIRKTYFSYNDNIWCADLADVQLISKFNKGIKYLLCVIDGFSRYAWVAPLKSQNGGSIVHAFQNVLKTSYHSSIKMQPKDVTDSSFAEYSEESNKKDPKFKVGDHIRILKYKNIFAKGYTPNWSGKIFVAKRIKNFPSDICN